MSLPISSASPSAGTSAPPPLPQVIPRYLESVYWWAYVHPRAVQVFEREWLVNTILFGHYATLRNHALAALAEPGQPIRGRTLQLACVYGNLSPRLLGRMADDATLEVVDVLPIQLRNLQAKLPADDPRVTLTQSDSSALRMPDASVDQVLLFFLLHEQPEAVRRGTLAEAMRVCRPGGRVVIVDYHRPVAWHPVRPLMKAIFHKLEPYAMALWQHPVQDWLPPGAQPTLVDKRTWFGGLYQRLILQA
jgi:ubiquinone/menaquinone biosynthesis C-methylase UbiE